MSEQQKGQVSQPLSWKEEFAIPDQGFFTAQLLEKANWMMLNNQKGIGLKFPPTEKKANKNTMLRNLKNYFSCK